MTATVHRTATVRAAANVAPGTRVLDLELDAELGFSGGQYIIVNTGVTLPNGKPAKRAYSMMSSDGDQRRLEIAVKDVPGPGSRALHDAPIGSAFTFSGPWGRLAAEPAPADARSLVVATDTGITACLGVLQSRAFRSSLATTDVLWLVESPSYFLPPELVHARIPTACASVRVARIAPIGAADRIAGACAEVRASVAERAVDAAYLAGDGLVIGPLRALLEAAGAPAERVRSETFFNHAIRKASA